MVQKAVMIRLVMGWMTGVRRRPVVDNKGTVLKPNARNGKVYSDTLYVLQEAMSERLPATNKWWEFG